jgi:hypothetical protein
VVGSPLAIVSCTSSSAICWWPGAPPLWRAERLSLSEDHCNIATGRLPRKLTAVHVVRGANERLVCLPVFPAANRYRLVNMTRQSSNSRLSTRFHCSYSFLSTDFPITYNVNGAAAVTRRRDIGTDKKSLPDPVRPVTLTNKVAFPTPYLTREIHR